VLLRSGADTPRGDADEPVIRPEPPGLGRIGCRVGWPDDGRRVRGAPAIHRTNALRKWPRAHQRRLGNGGQAGRDPCAAALRSSLGCVRSRPGRNCTAEFPELVELRETLAGQNLILDGELVSLGADGKPDFVALRRRLTGRSRQAAGSHGDQLAFMAFDVLHLNGRAVRRLPYWRRRELLAELELDVPLCRTPRHFVGEGEALLGATADQGLEGVVAKRLDAPYAEGRRSTWWVKQKHRRRERLVVTRWRERKGALPEFLLARQLDGYLRPAGSASLGLSADSRAELLATLAERELTPGRRRRGTRWARPEIEVVADVHGRPDGPVRDAVLREVHVPGLSEARDVVPRIIAPAPQTDGTRAGTMSVDFSMRV
jgi:ATP dependent DNA ligase domain